MNAQSEGSPRALELSLTVSSRVEADVLPTRTSLRSWLSPRSILIGITCVAAMGGALALATSPHLGMTSGLVAVAATIAGGLVVVSFLVRVALPAIDRTLTQQNVRVSKAEQQYRSIFENAVEGIFQTTPNGRYLKANPMLAQIYGYDTPAELIAGLTDIGSQLYTDSTRRDEFKRLLQSDDVVLNFDSQVRRRDGHVIWIRENARAIRDTKGQLIGYEGTVLDITARRQAQEIVQQAVERERATAGRIQKNLLLAEPPNDLSWLDIGAYTQASQAIDGDFYDFHRYNDTCVDILIGDVMGKGLPAALLAASIKSRYLRAIANLMYKSRGEGPPQPQDVIGEMHGELTPHFIGLELFATMCYLRFDNCARMVTFVDCGHTKTIHCCKDGSIQTLQSDFVPLGVCPEEIYEQRQTSFSPGDMFVCYSDGVTEASNAQGEMFGLDRLTSLVAGNRDASPSDLIDLITSAVLDHACGTTLADDLTVLVIRASDLPS